MTTKIEYLSMLSQLEWVDPQMAQDFEKLYKSSIYSAEFLHKLFLIHGNDAKVLIENGIKCKLSAYELDMLSDLKHYENLNKPKTAFPGKPSKEEKLPRKLRNGW